eukprot:gene12832-biopygen744
MPPKRADMGALRIYKDTDPRLSSENYLVLCRASSASSVNATTYIVLNKYKTSASYGRVETDLPHSATADLLDSLRHWPRDYVFVTRRGHNRPFASKLRTDGGAEVFSRLFGRYQFTNSAVGDLLIHGINEALLKRFWVSFPASTCNVTFGSDASRWESMYVTNFNMSGKAQLGSNVQCPMLQ